MLCAACCNVRVHMCSARVQCVCIERFVRGWCVGSRIAGCLLALLALLKGKWIEPKQHRFNVNSKLVCIIFHSLLVLQDLACLAPRVWVQDKSRPRHGWTSKKVWLFCAIVLSPPSPTTCLLNRTPTPATTMVKLSLPSLFRMMKQLMLQLHHPP